MMTSGLGPQDWPFSSLPHLTADCRESGVHILSTPLDQFCWDVVDSTWLPFLQWLCCSFHFIVKDGVGILCVSLGTIQYWWISIGIVIVQLSAVFCPSVWYLSFFCEAFSWTILDSSSFSLFHSGQVFHELVCPLTVVLPQIFFSVTTLFSFPVFFCLFHASLDVVVHFPVFLRSYRFKLFPLYLVLNTKVWTTIQRCNKAVQTALNKFEAILAPVNKWNRIHDTRLNSKKSFAKTQKTIMDTQLRWFQLRILHHILLKK